MYAVLFTSALVLSLIFCATPGALNTEALRRGVAGGFHRALMVELGSCIGDMTWAIIALVGLAFIVDNDIARIALGIFGGILLLYLAYKGFMEARKGTIPEGEARSGHSDFVTGALISLGNPFQIAFWIGIGGSAIAVIVPDPQLIDFAVFFVGWLVGGIVWCFAYSGLIAYGRKYVTPRLFQAINVICAVVLVYFALALLWATFVQ
jgi:threonine/homoserine/homoserine lactone efflux protein